MPDKTALGISEELRQFIEALVEEVVLDGKPFENQKKYLARFCQTESVDYSLLETNLSDLFETVEELKTHESKASEHFLRLLAKECYFTNDGTDRFISVINTKRIEIERKRKARKEAKREAKKEADEKAKELSERLIRKEKERAIDKRPEGVVAIDLGLPSGTKWASCNIGATHPEERGTYFAWGETEEKEDYDWNTYAFADGYAKSCQDIGDVISGTIYDVAYLQWGGKWRMPTCKQYDELIKCCDSAWITLNGVNGRKFTGPNGNSIFLPAAECFYEGQGVNPHFFDQFYDSEYFLYGYYWTGARPPGNKNGYAYCLFFDGELKCYTDLHFRCDGFTIRSVLNK